jgi:hypothetical protein
MATFFVVRVPGMGMPGLGRGSMGAGVFKTREAAVDFIKTGDLRNATIESHPVQGEYVAPSNVYSANRYLAGPDDYEFVGLFANFEEATRAAGEHPHVLEQTPR